MPYKFQTDKIKLPVGKDRRVKLTPKEKEKICKESLRGASQRELARKYKVSRRLIQFIIDPEKLEKNLLARKKRGSSKIYYNKDYHRESMKEHRQYKQKVLSGLE